MKLPKRLLTLSLMLLLVLSVFPSVFAEEPQPSEPNPAMPVITVRPESIRIPSTRRSFTLSLEAYIPNGDEVGYEWSNPSGYVYPNTTNTMTVVYGLGNEKKDATFTYLVKVYNLANPEYSVTETVTVEVYYTVIPDMTFSEYLAYLGRNYLGPVVYVFAPVIAIFLLPVILVYDFLYKAFR